MNININKQIQQKTIKKIMTAFGPARTVQLPPPSIRGVACRIYVQIVY